MEVVALWRLARVDASERLQESDFADYIHRVTRNPPDDDEESGENEARKTLTRQRKPAHKTTGVQNEAVSQSSKVVELEDAEEVFAKMQEEGDEIDLERMAALSLKDNVRSSGRAAQPLPEVFGLITDEEIDVVKVILSRRKTCRESLVSEQMKSQERTLTCLDAIGSFRKATQAPEETGRVRQIQRYSSIHRPGERIPPILLGVQQEDEGESGRRLEVSERMLWLLPSRRNRRKPNISKCCRRLWK
jgi:hypothetical protein